jgi:hypothetical protein
LYVEFLRGGTESSVPSESFRVTQIQIPVPETIEMANHNLHFVKSLCKNDYFVFWSSLHSDFCSMMGGKIGKGVSKDAIRCNMIGLTIAGHGERLPTRNYKFAFQTEKSPHQLERWTGWAPHGVILSSLDSCAAGASIASNSLRLITAQLLHIPVGQELLDGWRRPSFVAGAALNWLYRDIGYAFSIMADLPPAAVGHSLYPISRIAEIEEISAGASKLRKTSNFGGAILPVVIVIVISVDAVVFSIGIVLSNASLSHLAAERMWAVEYLTGYIALRPNSSPDRLGDFFDLLTKTLSDYELHRSSLLIGDDAVARITGWEVALRDIQLVDSFSDPPDSFYQFSYCISLDRGYSLASMLVRSILESYDTQDASRAILHEDTFVNLVTVLDSSLWARLEAYTLSLLAFTREQLSGIGTTLVVTMAVVLVAEIAILCVMVFFFISFSHSIASIHQLIRLLSPKDILAYVRLVDLITGAASTTSAVIMAPSDIIIREARDGGKSRWSFAIRGKR